MFLITTNCLQSVYNIHSVDFTKPPRPTFFHERGQPLSVLVLSIQSAQRHDQLYCPLIWVIIKPRGAVAVVRGEYTANWRSFDDKILVVLVWQPKP